jgi:2-phosphoglycerate kinase
MSDLKPSDDYKFQEAWDRVCQSFVISTGVDITKAPEYTVDEVLEQIRAKQEDNEERNAKYKVAKEVIGKTLDCINILGGIAAQGASMVCIPLSSVAKQLQINKMVRADGDRSSGRALYVSMLSLT